MPADRPVTELRNLIRAGEYENVEQVRGLLESLTDPLDVEAAGAVLRDPRARARLAECGAFTETRIALLGSSTLDSLPNLLTAEGVRRGLRPEIELAGFDQWRLEILDGAPHLAGLRPRVVGCLLDDSAVFAEVADPADVDRVVERCAEFPAELAAWASACRTALGGLVVLATIPLSPLRRHSLISFAARARVDAAWQRMNAEIADLAAGQGTVVLSGWDLSVTAGATFASDRMRHIASHAYAPEFLLAYARELVRVACADLGRVGKCLVLDLDDTLWGGVVGEEGPGALRMGDGYPGGAHTELQALARDLSRQGVLLAVCSKNDEPAAAEAIAEHPDMVLRPDSFGATRINWEPKPDNVRDLAAELDIGLDAMVFVDDSPVERDLMRRMAPEAVTVELPADPAGYAARLAARGDFAVLALTDEDRARTELYRAQARRRELVRSAGSVEEYLSGLESRLTVEPLTALNTGRVVQLFAKTNQFNLTGVRYAADDLERRVAAGGTAIYAARLTDRFADNGLIAAVALSRLPGGGWCVENMVLSCRVFGRAIEDAFVGLILRGAAARGAPAVLGRFQATAKNARFAGFYERLGFREAEPPGPPGPPQIQCYRHDLGDLAELPPWIQVTDSQEVFDVP